MFIRILSMTFLLACGSAALAGSERPAPDFRLQDQNGEWHALSDYAGDWLVVYFYPRADTPGCTTEACNFRDNIYAFRGVGAEVLGISTDPVDAQKAFSDKYSLPFAILSDADGRVAAEYGVLVERGEINFARRETFLIGPDGQIVKHYSQVDPESHTDEVLADLQSARAAADAL